MNLVIRLLSPINLILLMFLTACGGGSSSPTTPTTSKPGTAKNVIIDFDFNDCFISSNADVSIDYLMIDKQAKNLVWKCLPNKASETIFLTFNYSQQCYKLSGTIKNTNCSSVTAPAVPLFDVSIYEFTGNLYPIGGVGNSSLDHSAVAQNLGNISAIGVRWDIRRGTTQLLKSSIFKPIDHGTAFQNLKYVPNVPVSFNGIAIGETVEFTFTIRTIYGEILDSKTISLTN